MRSRCRTCSARYGTPEIGTAKVESAAAAIADANPHVTVEMHASRLVADNALDLIGRYDIVADGSDNFAVISSPMPASSRGRWSPPPSAFSTAPSPPSAPTRPQPDGTPNPTYRCLFPEPPPPGTVPACAEAGILGALTGVLGSLMALEVIQEIVGFGEGLVGRLVMLDARSMRFETLHYAWDPANPRCQAGTRRSAICRRTRLAISPESAAAAMPAYLAAGGDAAGGAAVGRDAAGGDAASFVQVATAAVPFTTDHLLSPAVTIWKQLGLEPFQVVQKPSLLSFHIALTLGAGGADRLACHLAVGREHHLELDVGRRRRGETDR